jgi:prepilin-type N-terminal cleavage/methylation domain-containing protein
MRQNRRAKSEYAFTLVELLVTIGILAILTAAVVIVLNPAKMLNDARVKTTKTNLTQLVRLINTVKGFSNKTLKDITLSGCSSCACGNTQPMDEIPQCVTNWENAVRRIEAEGVSGNIISNMNGFAKDPWGAPYILDENEGEGGSSDCRRDMLLSAGPDRISSTADDIRVPISIINILPGCINS